MIKPNRPPENYQADLQVLQAIDFSLVELTLYLDTHPDDLEALRQFNATAKKSEELRASFEKKYGPLRQFGHSYSSFPWQWSRSPWPWQV